MQRRKRNISGTKTESGTFSPGPGKKGKDLQQAPSIEKLKWARLSEMSK